MGYGTERLNQIFDKTDGNCHICHKTLVFANYDKPGSRGAWHVDHSRPQAAGGTHHLNNLFPACIQCNREKGAGTTRSARGGYGNTRAPYSQQKKEQIRNRNTVIGGASGAAIGGVIGGPVGAAAGALIGAAVGRGVKPPK